MKAFIEILGWYGALAILAAYTLVSFGKLSPQDIPYHLLNGTGALGIVVVALHKRDYQPAFLDIVWALLAVAAIINILF